MDSEVASQPAATHGLSRVDVSRIPIIDVAELVAGGPGTAVVAAQIDRACRQSGFFYVVGHGVDADLQHRLHALAREFFAQPVDI